MSTRPTSSRRRLSLHTNWVPTMACIGNTKAEAGLLHTIWVPGTGSTEEGRPSDREGLEWRVGRQGREGSPSLHTT